MFCKNCGIELNENAEFCSQCGKKVEESHTNKKIIVKNRKTIVAVAMIVLVAIIASIWIKSNNVNSSPEKVAAAVIKSEYEIDINTMIKCFPDFTIREIAVEEGLSETASRSEVIKKVKESYRYETPLKVNIICSELEGKYDVSNYTFFREIYEYMTNNEYKSITEVAEVSVDYFIDGEKESTQITCIKMKNKWYFLRDF